MSFLKEATFVTEEINICENSMWTLFYIAQNLLQ